MSSHYSRLQSKILVSECYLFIVLEWPDDVTGYCAHVLPGFVYSFYHRPSINKLDGAPAPARLVAGDAAGR